MFFDLLKGSDPSYPVLKFGDNLSSRNQDMAQSVILYSCDLERSAVAQPYCINWHGLRSKQRNSFESRTTKHCSRLIASTKHLSLPQQRRLWLSHKHPLHSYFKWLPSGPSGVRLSSPSCRTNRHRDTAVPSFIRLFNENIKIPSPNESELDPQ